MDNRIGAQYYTLRDTCTNLEDFAETCRRVSEIGYKTVQLSGIGDFEAKDIKPILDMHNLEVVCTHRPPMNYLENIEKEIEYHKILDCKIAGIGGGGAFFKSWTMLCAVQKKLLLSPWAKYAIHAPSSVL